MSDSEQARTSLEALEFAMVGDRDGVSRAVLKLAAAPDPDAAIFAAMSMWAKAIALMTPKEEGHTGFVGEVVRVSDRPRDDLDERWESAASFITAAGNDD